MTPASLIVALHGIEHRLDALLEEWRRPWCTWTFRVGGETRVRLDAAGVRYSHAGHSIRMQSAQFRVEAGS